MFDHKHYVPILKGKKGELAALARAENIKHFTPLVEVVPIPIKYGEDGTRYLSKTMGEHITDMGLRSRNATRCEKEGAYVQRLRHQSSISRG